MAHEQRSTDPEPKRITFVLRPDDAERLQEMADSKRTTISAIVREIVGAEIDRLAANV